MNEEIRIDGDAYAAVFYVPEGTVPGVRGANAIAVPVGTPYIQQAIRFIMEKDVCSKSTEKVAAPVVVSSAHFSTSNDVRALYIMRNVGEAPSHPHVNEKHPILRTTIESQKLKATKIHFIPEIASVDLEKPKPLDQNPNAVLVHWLGELVNEPRIRTKLPGVPPECKIHIQVGLSGKLAGSGEVHKYWRPEHLASPRIGRIVVVNIGEISDTHRVRKSQSYEAIAVDLLRYLRGDVKAPTPKSDGVLEQLSMYGPGSAPWSILAVRLNNSAVFVYICRWEARNDGKDIPSGVIAPKEFVEQGAWIICHKSQCAPMEMPELGKMLGFTGFVSSRFAAMAHDMCGPLGENGNNLTEITLDSIKSSLTWQRAADERGCIFMLFEKCTPSKRDEECRDGWLAKPDYNRHFEDVWSTVKGIRKVAVVAIQVDITRAVAHRTPWFMARSIVFGNANRRLNEESPSNAKIEAYFKKLATGWLSTLGDNEPSEPEDSDVPIVSIGDLKLTDRREVEDFLAIHQALEVYSKANETKPLNIAVFGAPGAGKSFGVTEVVKYIGRTDKGVFHNRQLQFNLGQFKVLNDFPAALHLVRDECLSGMIPIVFFDEFDAAFDGQAFGWLKFLLAPMQDGTFYDNGSTYKIGKCVFIFAGGVNRSFEELNGRIRNPGFCEAKGPDFISRLKAHLNIQGVNKPEDDGDQGRYVLRRGVLLHGIVRARLGLKPSEKKRPLLHPSVAYALLSLPRFKHGVRSLESIIKMCTVREGHPIGPSDLPSMEQMEMHVDASKLLQYIDEWRL